MSALPPKADIGTQSWNVRFVPKADIGAATRHARSDMCGLLFARCMSLLWGKADMPSRFGATVVAVITQRRKLDDASLLRNARFLRTPIFFGLASNGWRSRINIFGPGVPPRQHQQLGLPGVVPCRQT